METQTPCIRRLRKCEFTIPKQYKFIVEIGTCSKLKFSICTIVGNKRAELRIIA